MKSESAAANPLMLGAATAASSAGDAARARTHAWFPALALRVVLRLSLFAVAYAVAYRYGMSFSKEYASPFWFPDSILLCALLLCPWRQWWLLLAIILPIRLFSEVSQGAPLWFLLATYANDAVKGVLTAAALLRFMRQPRRFDSIGDFGVYCLFAVVLMPALSALAGAATRSALGVDFWRALEQWFLGDALAHLVVTPALMYWVVSQPWQRWQAEFHRTGEGCLIGAGLIGASYLAFQTVPEETHFADPRFYAPVPFLFWAAIRFGMLGATSAVTIIALFSIASALQGKGPFAGMSPLDTALALQHYLVLRAATVYVVAILIEQKKRDARALRDSEERYREVVESQQELVCRYLPDTTLTFVNGAYCRAFGKTREELIGQRFLTLIPEEQQPASLAVVRSVVEKRQPLQNEHRVLLPEGSVGWMEWQDSPIINDDGSVEELQGIGRDVTERHRTEQALRESEERTKLTAQTLSLGFFVWNPFTNRLWISDKVGALLGYEEGETVSYESFLPHVLEEDRAQVNNTVQRALSQLTGYEFECRVRLPDGEVRWIDVRARCLLETEGKLDQLTGIVMDVTEQKNASLRMRAQLEEMAHTSRLALVGELTASIAHEVNQPLGAILSNAEAAEMLLDADRPALEPVREILRDIRADDQRASEVIRRLRTLLRKRELNMEAVDFNALISETLHFITYDANRRGVTISTDLSVGLAPVHGDRLHLQQVLLNLLLNGMDAMAQTPSAQRGITVRTRPHATGGVECLITDRGPGIPPERLPRLFESFFTTKSNGVGLGLSIARSIVEAHRGEIWAENSTDAGAAFHLILCPANSANPPSPSHSHEQLFPDP